MAETLRTEIEVAAPQATVFAFLTYLEDRGDISHEVTGARSLWRAV